MCCTQVKLKLQLCFPNNNVLGSNCKKICENNCSFFETVNYTICETHGESIEIDIWHTNKGSSTVNLVVPTFTSCLRVTPSEPRHVMILGRLTPPASLKVDSKLFTYTTSVRYSPDGSIYTNTLSQNQICSRKNNSATNCYYLSKNCHVDNLKGTK